jgi:hypothetical protein
MSFYAARVRLGHGGMSALSPFYSQLRTLVGAAGTAVQCQLFDIWSADNWSQNMVAAGLSDQ